MGYSNTADDAQPYWIVRNSWGPDWGEGGYVRMAITGGYGNCGINLEPTIPNIYFMNEINSSIYLVFGVLGIGLGLGILSKLSWCKNESLLFLHEGQLGLVKLSYAMLVFFTVMSSLFAAALGSVTLPIWMLYRVGLVLAYGCVHLFLCVLHYLLGSVDRASGDAIKLGSTMNRITLSLLCLMITALSVAAFVLELLEN